MKQDFINNNLQREPITAATAIGLGISAASAGGQIAATGKMNRKTRQWNEKMYGIQRQDAIEDRDYNNYTNQVARMKAAGLNPALIYGDNGAGAVTQTRGSSPGSYKAEAPPVGGMGLALGAQVALMKAQKENIEANTENIKAGTGKTTAETANVPLTGENIKASTENIQQGTVASKVQTDLNKLKLEKDTATFNDEIDTVMRQRQQAESMAKIKLNESKISDATYKTMILQVRADYAGTLLINELTRAKTKETYSNIKVNEADIYKKFQEVQQGWEGLYNQGRDVNTRERSQHWETFINDMQQTYKVSAETIKSILGAAGIAEGMMNKKPNNTYHDHVHYGE